MKKLLFSVLCLSLISNTPVDALAVTTQSPPLPDNPVKIVGYEKDDVGVVFVQLFNDSSTVINIDSWHIITKLKGSVVESMALHGWLKADGYMVIGDIEGADEAANFNEADEIVVQSDVYNEAIGLVAAVGRFELSKSSAGNYTKTSKFVPANPESVLLGGDSYAYPTNTPLRVVSVLANPAKCLPPATEAGCREFIKLKNISGEPVDMSRFRIRVGHANVAAGIANTFYRDEVLQPGQYMSVVQRDDGESLALPASSGGVWIEDEMGLKVYPETVYDYGDISDNKNKGNAWSLNEKTGKWQWSVPTLESENNFTLPLATEAVGVNNRTPCRSDQYRNPETGRCRLKTAKTAKKPCSIGQYRNPETGRCKSATSVASSLKPCAANQVRNPETNRCRATASLAKTYAPCPEGKERNPETNRCRTVVGSPPAAEFVPEAAKKTGDAFIGWWALGGVGMLALGRLGWEWRNEIRAAISKVPAFFTSNK